MFFSSHYTILKNRMNAIMVVSGKLYPYLISRYVFKIIARVKIY
jgi:hypothetical protein